MAGRSIRQDLVFFADNQVRSQVNSMERKVIDESVIPVPAGEKARGEEVGDGALPGRPLRA